MKRNEKAITETEIIEELLKRGKYATISLSKENEPYLVTLSYGYDESKNALYFHCAKEGQKIDFIKSNSNACGTIIEDNGYEDGCGQAFRSLVFRGTFKIVKEIKVKKHAFDIMLNHLETNPDTMKEKFFKNDEAYENPGILRLDITEIIGKEEKAES
jgi:nitroimidazol reductase NimA-like FMN-containing flavoprotein (pyridoxamine 5'-phosphate oxidase superfamily)